MEAPPPYDASADSGGVAKPSTPRDESIRLNFGLIRTPPGALMIINLVLLFLAWVIMAGWRGEVSFWVEDHYEGKTGFFLAASVIPWLVFLVMLVIMLFNIHAKLSRFISVPFPLIIMLNCALWGVLLFIASCVIADLARKHNDSDGECTALKCHHLGASAAFGFFASVGLFGQAFLHFREWRSS